MGPAPRGGSCEGGKVPTFWEVPSRAGRSAWTEGELQSLKGECGYQCAEGRMESDLHRLLTPPPCASQPEVLTHQCWWRLGAEAQASEVTARERTRVVRVETA